MRESLRWLPICMSVLALACHKDSARPDEEASAEAGKAAASSEAPREGLVGAPGLPRYEKTADDAFTVFDPDYVAVGDPFAFAADMQGDCAPRGGFDPPLATLLGVEIFTPRFATPLRNLRAHFRATAPGTSILSMGCSRGDASGRVILRRRVQIVDRDDAAPFVDIDGGTYAGALASALETARVAALACYRSELTRDPKVRGSGQMQVWIEKSGALSVPQDRPDVAGPFRGISTEAGDCVRKATGDAMAAQKRADATAAKDPKAPPWRERGVNAELAFRFEVRPKAGDPTACDRYAARWKACAHVRESSRFLEPHDAIVLRTKVATTDEARGALAFACAAALRDLSVECH